MRMPKYSAGTQRRALFAGLALTLVSEPLLADSSDTGDLLQEVIVTATKREQSIQDVGISMAAYSAEQLTQLGAHSSTDIASFTPGVFVGGSIAGETELFTIRGVTQNDFTDSVESPIAVYVDDSYIAMAQGQKFGMFDLDRVEVAKGPQGTLFGRNATGGLIQYVTRQPTDTPEGYLDVTGGRYDNVGAEGALSGPINEMISGRVSAYFNKFDPILNDIIPAADLHPTDPTAGGGEDEWDDDSIGVRTQLKFKPNDRFDAELVWQYQHTKTSTGPYVNSATVPVYNQQGVLVNTVNASPTEDRLAILLNANGQDTGGYVPLGGGLGVLNGCYRGGGPPPAACSFRSVPGGDAFGFVQPPGLVTEADFAYGDLNHFSTTGESLRLNYKLTDDIKLTATSNIMRYTKFVTMDVDAAPESQSIYHSESHETTYSQEIRLNGDSSRVKWVGGVYYLNVLNSTENGLEFPAASPFATDPLILGAPGPVDTVGFINLHTISSSIFGQVDIPLADQWTLVAGGRYVKEKKDYSFFQGVYKDSDDRLINTSVFYSALFPYHPFNTDDNLYAGKVQLEYRPIKDTLVYLGVNRGAKAGGFNAQLADGSPRLPLDQIPYKPENLTNYEGGVKSTFLDGRLRTNASIFYYDYKDYQAFLFEQSSGVVVNKDAFMRGGEFEVTASPVSGLEMQLGVSGFQAIVKGLELQGPAGVPPIYMDVHPSFAPEKQISGLIRYGWPLGDGKMAVQLDSHYTSDFYHNLRNFEADHYPGYTISNARVAWSNDHWEFAAFVKNLADKRYYTIGYDLATLCGCNENAFGPPRWPGAEFKYRFGP
jgi:iron complex outermembrane receptor protein